MAPPLPDTPLLLSGACGGPFVIFLCTPLRNALTLGSQDKGSGVVQLYKKVFRGGTIRSGWTGGGAPAVVACPQFLALGPVYHFLHGNARELFGVQGPEHRVLPSVLAATGAGLFETLLTFGSQSRNAQMAYNNSFVQFASVAGIRRAVPLNSPTQIWGVGAGAMAARNIVTNTAIRSFAPWFRENLPLDSLGAQSRATVCDVLCSVLCCLVSAPVHQLFNFLATTPEAQKLPRAERFAMARRFITEQYFLPKPREVMEVPDLSRPLPKLEYSWRFSPVALRDFGMRTVYVTTVYSIFVGIERTLCSLMRS